MRKQMIENAAYEVATQVRAVEESIESALTEIAELQTRMVRARGATGAGFVTSHPAFEQLAATTGGLDRRAWRNRQLPRRARRDQAIDPRPAYGRLRRR